MSPKTKLLERVNPILAPDDEIVVATVCQVRGGMKNQLGRVGLLVAAAPAACWLVVTHRRVLLVARAASGPGAGPVVFDAPRSALAATLKSVVVHNEVTLSDPTDGQSLVRLNLGVKGGLARRIVTAVHE